MTARISALADFNRSIALAEPRHPNALARMPGLKAHLWTGLRAILLAPTRLAARDPVGPGIGHGVDMHLAGIIVDGEGDNGLAACWNGAQAGGDLVPAAALVWQVREAGDGGLDLVQSARGGLRA